MRCPSPLPVPVLATMLLALGVGCRGPNWQAGPAVLAASRQVAEALDDPTIVSDEQVFDPRSVPKIDPPKKLRPCCAFGMDLGVELQGVPVPGYEIGNIFGPEDTGPHEYNNGSLTVQTEAGRGPVLLEKNGLVYTCRGGFVDLAHVRDNADLTLFLTWGIMPLLPAGGVIELPTADGAQRRLIIKEQPKALLARYGRMRVATTLAEWAAYRLSIWHEIVTWYGYETVAGISERESAFTPEDLYSNVLGIKLSAGILRNNEARSRDAYNHAMDAWLQASLRRLGALSREGGRQAMKALDGQWWDSRKRVPQFELVTRRFLDLETPVRGWLLSDAFSDERIPRALRQACDRKPPPLPLDLPDRLGGKALSDLVSLELLLEEKWNPEGFPIATAHSKPVTPADFPAIVEAIRRAGVVLGPRFDEPEARTPPAAAGAPAQKR